MLRSPSLLIGAVISFTLLGLTAYTPAHAHAHIQHHNHDNALQPQAHSQLHYGGNLGNLGVLRPTSTSSHPVEISQSAPEAAPAVSPVAAQPRFQQHQQAAKVETETEAEVDEDGDDEYSAPNDSRVKQSFDGVDPYTMTMLAEAEAAAQSIERESSTGPLPIHIPPPPAEYKGTAPLTPGYMAPPLTDNFFPFPGMSPPSTGPQGWQEMLAALADIEGQLAQFDANNTANTYPHFFQITGTALSARLGAISTLNSTLANYVDTVVNFDDHIFAINNADKESELWLNTKYSIMAVMQSIVQQLAQIETHVDYFAQQFQSIRSTHWISPRSLTTTYVKTLADEMLKRNGNGICGVINYAQVPGVFPSSTGPSGPDFSIPPPLPAGADGSPPGSSASTASQVSAMFRRAIFGQGDSDN